MDKDFDEWNIEKKKLNYKSGRFYHEREIWWCSLGINVGNEHDGGGSLFQRPVLVLRGLSAHTCMVAPLTTSISKHPMRMLLGNIDGKESSVILSQMRIVDTRRFTERLAILDKAIFNDIRKAVKTIF